MTKKSLFSFFSGLCLALVLIFGLAQMSYAQSKDTSALPPALKSMEAQGAQFRYLGNDAGLQGWMAIQNGQEQYFYVMPGGDSFMLGLLFDKDGSLITGKQIKALQEGADSDILDMLTGIEDMAKDPGAAQTGSVTRETQTAFKTPSEQLFEAVETSNWIPVGANGAPVIYSFVDPQCPHCHAFIEDMKPYIADAKVQIRMIPVGFRDETRAQAAFLLAMPSPQERFFRYLDGDETALPVLEELNQQGVQRNLSVMQSWKLNVTPLSIYRAKDGKVKIVQGRAQNVRTVLRDLVREGG